MEKTEFIERIAEALGRDAEGFTMDSPMQEELGWDSVAVLSLIVLMDELGKPIQGVEVWKCQTPADLWALL